MPAAHILGFPRIGAQRELKFALEHFWRDPRDAAARTRLVDTGCALRASHWARQREAGLDCVAVGDFAWYDHVLTTFALVGALPPRFGFDARRLTLAQYFEMARGNAGQPALEMTKWFDTNYHYLVPEYTPAMSADDAFGTGVDWLFDELAEARALGHAPKPVLVGPLTLLYLGKEKDGLADRLALLPGLLRAYARLLGRLREEGVFCVQIDEPILALDLDARWLDAFDTAYGELGRSGPPLLLATYFGDVSAHAARLKRLPVAGLHLDLARAPQQLAAFVADWPADKVLSAGVIDGRNVWRNDLDRSLTLLRDAHAALGERLWIASSCSLLHVPVDLAGEMGKTADGAASNTAGGAPDAELRGWLAFAAQKLDELRVLKSALEHGEAAVAAELEAARTAAASRRTSPRIHNPLVAARVAALRPEDERRASPYAERAARQQARFKLPPLPTTTIGSFPQTDAIRKARAEFKAGRLGHLDYLEAMRAEICDAIGRQEQLGLDVLVHGEAERNDMVEYFAGLLWGFAVTANGWVQSYGSRCVKPPVIYGDVYLPEPMTVAWSRFAQQQTDKPVKGMLTGPVTMLQWSFVRDDQPRATTALQIALALREEVSALEQAGIGVIQIDEPAIREGLPLQRAAWDDYLAWAVRAFRVASSGVVDDTQIHTHMCYSEFDDILPAIAALDADVLSIETARSAMELLDAFEAFAYPNEIGPGVYDIHSPRVPSQREIETLLRRALERIPSRRLWVNPDCGLKTRGWPEVEAALTHLVAAAQTVRTQLA